MDRIKLLLIDDQPVFRQGLAVLLKENASEFEVVGEASSIEEALVIVEQFRPDIVIIDINMKNGQGVNFISLMRDRFPMIKPLVLTASDEEENLVKAVKAGAYAYLVKTAGFEELTESIRIVMAGESVLSPSLTGKLMSEFRNGESEKTETRYLYMLTNREKEVLQYAAQGYSNLEIATSCCISLTTVKSHFRHIMKKLGVKNRMGAIAMANSYGLLGSSSISPVGINKMIDRDSYS